VLLLSAQQQVHDVLMSYFMSKAAEDWLPMDIDIYISIRQIAAFDGYNRNPGSGFQWVQPTQYCRSVCLLCLVCRHAVSLQV